LLRKEHASSSARTDLAVCLVSGIVLMMEKGREG
jgi:hypothetical protein